MSPLVLAACGGGGGSLEPPQIARQPADATVQTGADASLSVDVTGGASTFQWLRNGVEVAGATQASLKLPASLLDSGAVFSVRASNAAGSVTSRTATLTVTSPALTILAGAPTSPDPMPAPGTSTAGYVDGTGSAARFQGLGPIAVDDAGNIYVGEGNIIRKVSPLGVVTTFAGSNDERRTLDGTAATARFLQIQELVFDRTRQLLVSLEYAIGIGVGMAVREITLAGTVTTVAGIAGTFDHPTRAPDGTLYGLSGNSVDGGLGPTTPTAVYRLSTTGAAVLVAGQPGVGGFMDGPGAQALFRGPTALLADGKGNVYVADNACLRRIGADGTVVTLAGAPATPPAGAPGGTLTLADGTGAGARFGYISDLRMDSSGNILVVDHGEAAGSNKPEDLNLIRRVTPEGRVTTIARSGGTQYRGAWRLALGGTGIAYVLGMFWVGRFEPFAG